MQTKEMAELDREHKAEIAKILTASEKGFRILEHYRVMRPSMVGAMFVFCTYAWFHQDLAHIAYIGTVMVLCIGSLMTNSKLYDYTTVVQHMIDNDFQPLSVDTLADNMNMDRDDLIRMLKRMEHDHWFTHLYWMDDGRVAISARTAGVRTQEGEDHE